MVLFKRAPRHDAVVILARIAAKAWLRLAAAAARFGVGVEVRIGAGTAAAIGGGIRTAPGACPMPDDPATQVSRLERMAERGIWRSETIAALHAEAGDAVALAEQDYAQTLAELARTRAVQQSPPTETERPAGDAPLAA